MDTVKYKIDQISVFIENKKGRFFSVTKVLKEAGVNIRAMSLADTVDFGILRFVVDKPETAYDVLMDRDFIARKNSVLAIAVNDKCGGLSNLLEVITKEDLNVEYMYTFLNALEKKAVMLFRFEDINAAIEKFLSADIELLNKDYIKNV